MQITQIKLTSSPYAPWLVRVIASELQPTTMLHPVNPVIWRILVQTNGRAAPPRVVQLKSTPRTIRVIGGLDGVGGA